MEHGLFQIQIKWTLLYRRRTKKRNSYPGKTIYCKICENSPQGLTGSYLSEYIGSHLFQMAGIEAQETFLGTCDGLPVVVMKDFIGENESFVPFNDVGDSTLERRRERYRYTYEDIMHMLEENMKLTDVKETIQHFWKMYLMDAWMEILTDMVQIGDF